MRWISKPSHLSGIQHLSALGEKKTIVEKDEMVKVAVAQLAAREISMDASVMVLLSAVKGWHFRIERRMKGN